MALVDVLDDGRDLGVEAAELGHEVGLARELLAVGDDGEQDLAGGAADAHDGVAQGPAAAVLLVGTDAQALGHAGDVVQDGSGGVALDEARVGGHDAVAVRGVEAGADGGAAVAGAAGVAGARGLAGREGRRRLVAIAAGLVHPDDVVDRGVVSSRHVGEEAVDVLALAAQLDGVGDGEPLAAAAVARDRAGVGLESHGVLSGCLLAPRPR